MTDTPGIAKTNEALTALIVDDSATNRFLLRTILTAAGHRAHECESGQQCLDYCKEKAPDVVLLDVMMPQLDGVKTCQLLREKYSRGTLPIMIVTTCTDSAIVTAALDAGASDYLTKPVDRNILLARIENQRTLSRSARMIETQQQELQRALEIQRATGDVLPDAIAVHDDQGKIVYANAQLVKWCNGSTPSTIEDAHRWIAGGAFANVGRECLQLIRHQPSFDREFKVKGTSVQILSQPVVTEVASGTRLWLWRDLSRMRELERIMSQQVKLNTVTLFAVGVAHNFNNYLGGMTGAVDMLATATAGQPRAEKCVGVIRKAVQSATYFTRKMTTLERRGKEVGKHMVLADVVSNVVDIQRQLVQGRVAFEIDIPKSLPEVAMSYDNLVDVLSNLITNAVEAVGTEGKVTIRAIVPTEQTGIILSLHDNGAGIAPEAQGRLFEPFFSTKGLDTVNGISVTGRGLGLWNVYNLLKACGGDITIDSTPGAGTTVQIELPVVSFPS